MMKTLMPLAVLVGIQVVDFEIHYATDQVEVMRVVGNVVIAGWAILAALGIFQNGRHIAATLGIYLAFNLFFLGQNGMVNAAQGGPRVLLFVLIAATLLAGFWARQRLWIKR